MRTVQPNATGVQVSLQASDSTDGTNETGIAYNTSGISLWYRRTGGAKVAITPVTLAALTTAWTSGGVLHIGDGVFRLDVPDAAFVSGAATVLIGGSATGMIFDRVEIQLKYEPTAIRVATATAGGGSSITLDASASAVTDNYVGYTVQTLSGTGLEQSRQIIAYNGTTKVATVDRTWGVNPASGTVFAIHPGPGVTGMTTTEVAGAVLNAVSASYVTAGTVGKKISDSGAASTPPTTAEITTAVLAGTVATGVTLSDAIRGCMAVLFGKSSVSGTTRIFRNMEDSKDVVTATVDSSNQRTAVTRSLTQ